MKFYQLSPQERRAILQDQGLKLADIDDKSLIELNQLSENVIGEIRLPLGVVQNLLVNNCSYLVPLATEEPSVVAAANHGAGIFAKNGGVKCSSDRPGIYGQIVLRVDSNFSQSVFEGNFPEYITKANERFHSLILHGGGLRRINAELEADLLFIRVLVDPAEAMGANKTNAILEYLAEQMLAFPGISEKLFAILSNYPSQFARAEVKIDPETIGGQAVAKKIALLSKIAQTDVYRAVTNNKGIMNGVDAVLMATGNDYRAVEAATAVHASQTGYTSLSKWFIAHDKLIGQLSLPLAIGTVGGSIKARNDVQQSFSLLGDVSSAQLAEIIAGIGLANNLAALLAISTKGIQAGHMKLQARNIVATLNATTIEKAEVLAKMIENKNYSEHAAQTILEQIRKEAHADRN